MSNIPLDSEAGRTHDDQLVESDTARMRKCSSLGDQNLTGAPENHHFPWARPEFHIREGIPPASGPRGLAAGATSAASAAAGGSRASAPLRWSTAGRGPTFPKNPPGPSHCQLKNRISPHDVGEVTQKLTATFGFSPCWGNNAMLPALKWGFPIYGYFEGPGSPCPKFRQHPQGKPWDTQGADD